MKSVTILGATGSIGKSTVDLLLGHRDKYKTVALTAHKNVALLAEQARLLNARHAVIGDETLYNDLKNALSGTNTTVAAGAAAVVEAATMPADWIMAAILGAAGIEPTLKAIQQGKIVALANKESLVAAGTFMMDAVKKSGGTLLPVDSEHNAVFQVFDPTQRAKLKRIILTASGGPFLRRNRDELHDITPAEAVRHPNWSMGAKISVDSATMMNKALEIIEASYLFELKSEQVDAIIHPQSVVHSMVEYIDGSILAQMGAPDMRTPIAYTLGWPERIQTTGQTLNLMQNMNLSFEAIDIKRFPAIKLARQVLAAGQGAAITLNAANEVAVEAFLAGKIKFTAIEMIAEKALQIAKIEPISSLDDIFAQDLASARLRVVVEYIEGYHGLNAKIIEHAS